MATTRCAATHEFSKVGDRAFNTFAFYQDVPPGTERVLKGNVVLGVFDRTAQTVVFDRTTCPRFSWEMEDGIRAQVVAYHPGVSVSFQGVAAWNPPH